MVRFTSAGWAVLIAGLLPACALFTTLDGLSGPEEGAADAGGAETAASASPTATSAPGSDGGPPGPTLEAGPGEPGAAYRAAVVADAPKGYFRLDEVQGNGCVDVVGSTDVTCIYPGTGATRGAPGIAGTRGLHFDSASSVLSVYGAQSALAEPYTIELWFVEDAVVKGASIVSFQNVGQPRNGIFVFVDDALAIHSELWAAGSLLAYGAASTPLVAGAWHHLALVHSTGPDQDRLFIDGALADGLNNAALTRPTINVPLTFGGFVGAVDEVAVYDRALAAGRIAAHFAAK